MARAGWPATTMTPFRSYKHPDSGKRAARPLPIFRGKSLGLFQVKMGILSPLFPLELPGRNGDDHAGIIDFHGLLLDGL